MTVLPAALTKIYIGGTTEGPQSELAYQEIGEIANGGEIGPQFELITFAALADRNVRKFKGTRNDGTITLELGKDAQDAGQADLLAALESDLAFNFKIELNDNPGGSTGTPTTIYFQGKVFSYVSQIGEVNSIIGATCTIEVDSGTVVEVAAAA